MSHLIERAVETPVSIPMLEHWNGVYDHVWVVLHPFVAALEDQGDDVLQTQLPTTTQANVASAVGGASFEDFAVATMLAEYGMSSSVRSGMSPRPSDELVVAIREHVASMGLDYPTDDAVAPALFPKAAEVYRAIGVSHVEVWDRFRTGRIVVSLADLSAGRINRRFEFGAIVDEERTAIFDCSFGSMDHHWSALAFTERAANAVRVSGFEAFAADDRTTPNWVNEPLSYEPPADWPA